MLTPMAATMLIHILRDLILPALHTRVWPELPHLGLGMHCHLHGVTARAHPHRLARLVCDVFSLPGQAHPLNRK